MLRVMFFLYGIVNYLMFVVVYGLLAAFVGNVLLPKTIDAGRTSTASVAVLVDVALLALFAVQHSVMARPAFKRVWTRVVPQPIERSTYLLFSNAALLVLMWLWQPLPAVVWNVQHPVGWWLLVALFIAGWFLVPTISLMINHFDLFGLRQVWLHVQGKEYESLPFQTPLAYQVVRHPLYIGWGLAFWATPVMTAGHLLFAAVMTVYMVAASKVEERDLLAHFGEHYEAYRKRVPAFIPVPRYLATAEKS
jgi:protein-S-isoprenylcysteine O-methyltransferase Ste14